MMLPKDESKQLIIKVVVLCILWFAVSSINNIIGKVVLNRFPFPITVTMIQLVSIFIFLRPTLKYLRVSSLDLKLGKRYYLKMIIPLAFAKFLSSVSSHVSLWKVPVSYSHTVKSAMPLFVVVLSRVLLGEKQTMNIYFSLVPIIAGVIIATATELSFDLLGLMAALFSIFVFSLMNIFSKKVLKDIPTLHHLSLLYILSKYSLLLFTPIWIYFDFITIVSQLKTNPVPSQVYVLLFLDGFCNYLQNIIAFTILSMVTPLTYSVTNCTKRISIIISSLITLKNPVGFTNIIGMLLAVFGVLYYNTVRYYENQTKKLPQFINNDLKYDNLLSRNLIKTTNGYANGFTKTGLKNGYSNGYTSYKNGLTNSPTYVNIY